ncbi:MAG: type II secretion system protein GspK, partial [Mariprofundaceae bacterium]|nr:type II secretion system protein GspK [Mariprofundaceae bacterium]
STLSMGLSQMARHHVADVQQRQQLLDQELAMKSAAQRALYYLLTGTPKQRSFISGNVELPVDGQWLSWGNVEVSVQDGAGLMGLAIYNQDGLERLFVAGGVEQAEARVISARLGDWIDADSFVRPGGGEAATYLKSSAEMLPRDAPLRSLDGMLELPEISSELYNGIDGRPGLRDLLVAGSESYFNPASAPELLLGPVLGISDTQVAQLIALKRKQDWDSMRVLVPYAQNIDIAYHPGFEFILRFRTATTQGRAIYRLSPFKTVPYRLIMWQYPDHARG